MSAAERDGLTLICVTLNDPNDWADHAALLDWGFSSYQGETVLRDGERVGYLPLEGSLLPTCPVEAGDGLTAALAPGEQVEIRAEVDGGAAAPLTAGEVVGELVCAVNGEELARIPLVAGVSAGRDRWEPETWWEEFWSRLTG